MLQNTLFTTLALCAAAVSATDPVTTQILLAGFNHQDIVGSVVTSVCLQLLRVAGDVANNL
jgi:hypothetical protein